MIFSSSSIAPCTDCRSLTTGADLFAVPHEYLVLRRPGPMSIYQCLVCHANLACDAESGSPHWAALSPMPDEQSPYRPAPTKDKHSHASR